ncbi:hypothetical protein E4N62_03465 [Streptomyces sp. MNU76]|uniref:hypothetical protein n=1 Tax=Streptomyces sp. MNU76 TaxID=2560026 RepID=UPI001E2E47B3|nr:hypothetical protein [Streptomyces sp. MNU76]MCC9704401.1 hypothetical protein [Streptomyces sp. MNU76]
MNRLHAELTATKIAAQTPLSLTPSPMKDPEPVRRRRHLALYIGGTVAAFFAGVGDRLRSFVRGRRAVLAVAATSVLVAERCGLLRQQQPGSATTPRRAWHIVDAPRH